MHHHCMCHLCITLLKAERKIRITWRVKDMPPIMWQRHKEGGDHSLTSQQKFPPLIASTFLRVSTEQFVQAQIQGLWLTRNNILWSLGGVATVQLWAVHYASKRGRQETGMWTVPWKTAHEEIHLLDNVTSTVFSSSPGAMHWAGRGVLISRISWLAWISQQHA